MERPVSLTCVGLASFPGCVGRGTRLRWFAVFLQRGTLFRRTPCDADQSELIYLDAKCYPKNSQCKCKPTPSVQLWRLRHQFLFVLGLLKTMQVRNVTGAASQAVTVVVPSATGTVPVSWFPQSGQGGVNPSVCEVITDRKCEVKSRISSKCAF